MGGEQIDQCEWNEEYKLPSNMTLLIVSGDNHVFVMQMTSYSSVWSRCQRSEILLFRLRALNKTTDKSCTLDVFWLRPLTAGTSCCCCSSQSVDLCDAATDSASDSARELSRYALLLSVGAPSNCLSWDFVRSLGQPFCSDCCSCGSSICKIGGPVVGPHPSLGGPLFALFIRRIV